MREILGGLVWLGMISISAAEIVAWKVPLDRYSFRPGERLASPPEASPFFSPGDELRSPEMFFGKDAAKIEWAVWNETTGTLVTKSSTEELWPLYRELKPRVLPHQCRVRLDVFETAGTEPIGPDAKPTSSLEWVIRSKRKSSAMIESKGTRIEANAEVNRDDTGQWIDLALEGTIQLPGQEPMEFLTDLAMKSGSSVWAAGDRTRERGLEVRITASTILMDGTPLADSIQIQKEGRAMPFLKRRPAFERHRVGGKAWLCLAPSDIASILPGRDSSDEDPFTEAATPVDPTSDFRNLKLTKIPETVLGQVRGPVLDIRDVMANLGIMATGETDFIGYDLPTETVVFHTESDTEADKLEKLLSPVFWPQPRLVSVGCEGNGKTHVKTCSGRKAHVTRGADKKNPARSLTVDPVADENGFVEVEVRYNDRPSPGSSVQLKTSMVLDSDRPVEVIGGGLEAPVKMKGSYGAH